MSRAQEIFDNVLKGYQQEAVKWMCGTGRALEYDAMGLGKTLQILTTIEMTTEIKGTTIIVAPKFALAVWQGEIDKWFGKESTIYSGTPKVRKDIWNTWIKNPTDYIITNFAMLPELGSNFGIQHKNLASPPPGTNKYLEAQILKAIVIDEAHMAGVFNYKTKFYKASSVVYKYAKMKFVLSGTPIRQGCIDTYGPLSLLDPQRFNSYWKFVQKYCVVLENPFGKSIERNPANIKEFRSMLGQYMVRRTKEEVLKELPPKQRQKLPVTMNKIQLKAYTELQDELMTLIPDIGEILITPGMISVILRQRQLLAAPEILGFKTASPGVVAIIDHSHLRLDEGVPVVVFTTFRTMIPILERAFTSEYPGIAIHIIQGGLGAQEFGEAWNSFQKGKGARVLLVVIKSGASFQATAADTAYFIGPEWDVSLNEQAEDRLHRIGQENFVNIFYVDYGTPIEARIWQLLNEKKESSMFIAGTEEEYLRVIKSRTK